MRYIVYVEAAPISSTRGLPIDLRGLDVAVHAHLDLARRQFIVLKAPRYDLLIIASGENLVDGPARLMLQTPDLDVLGQHISSLSVLNHLLTGRPIRTADQRPTPAQSIKQRDALIASDGKRARASLKQIAVAIHGAEHVERGWRDVSDVLRAKVKRDLVRGRQCIARDHRQLL